MRAASTLAASKLYWRDMLRRNLAKPFTIAGFIGGEIYMLFTVLSPGSAGVDIPFATLFWRAATTALFFGPFGAAVGLGIGLLVSALLERNKK